MSEEKKRKLDIYAHWEGMDKRTRFKVAGELMIRFETVYDTILRRFDNRSFKDIEIPVVTEIISKYED